ncbi:MAG: helix-turn-helix transcriptional regulator [Myxococcota bacterium]
MEDFDPISVIEAAYRLERTQSEWMSGILEQVRPVWDEGFGVGMFEARIDDAGRPDIGLFVTAGDEEEHFERIVRAMNKSIDQAQVEHSYLRPFVYSMLSEQMKPLYEDFRDEPVYQKYAHPIGVYDCRAARILDPSGTMYILAAPCPEIRETSDRARATWARVVAHLAAADRLRRHEFAASADSADVDAVLDSSGRLLYVDEGELHADANRDALERAAEAIGRARGGMRRTHPGRALQLWQALVEGRYSLVEFVDSDGKEFLLARRNAPCTDEPAGLTQRERQVVHFALSGHSDVLIGYELGLDVAKIEAALDSALSKMNLKTREDLMRLGTMLRAPESLEQ